MNKNSYLVVGIWIISIVLTAVIASNHGAMKEILFPLRTEFAKVSAGSYTAVNSGSISNPDVSWEFGGKLDEIVQQRRAILRENGYIILGKWHAPEGTNNCLYLKVWF